MSTQSLQSKQGFTPYQSAILIEEKDLSNFAHMNLSDQISLLQNPTRNNKDYSLSDLYSDKSRRRKGSQQFKFRQSSMGNSFLNKSFADRQQHLEGGDQLQFEQDNEQFKKDLSQNSCPVVGVSRQQDINDIQEQPQKEVPRFYKTKNILRNISTYLHNFILHNQRAKKKQFKYLKAQYYRNNNKILPSTQIIKNSLKEQSEQFCEASQEVKNYVDLEMKQFHQWVKGLSMVNFKQYEIIWTQISKFKNLYRWLCYQYYSQQAFCDIYRSRLTTKKICNQLLYQFLQGLMNPNFFYKFK